jgi:hypothetical protein
MVRPDDFDSPTSSVNFPPPTPVQPGGRSKPHGDQRVWRAGSKPPPHIRRGSTSGTRWLILVGLVVLGIIAILIVNYRQQVERDRQLAAAQELQQHKEHEKAQRQQEADDRKRQQEAETPIQQETKEAAQKEAAQKEAAQKEAAQKEAAQKEAAQKEAAQKEAALKEAAQKEAALKEAAAQKEAAQKEAAQKEAALKEAAQKEAAQQQAAQKEREWRESESTDDFDAWMALRAQALDPKIHRFTLVNNCSKTPIAVAAHFVAPAADTTWVTLGWWEVLPGTPLHINLVTQNSYVYFYAYGEKASLVWSGKGPDAVDVEVVSARFMHLPGLNIIGPGRRTVTMQRRYWADWGTHQVLFRCDQ